MKSYTVLATFPHLPAKDAQQAATGEGCCAAVAVERALKVIFSREAIKGRRIESFNLRVTCNGKVVRA